MSVKSGKRRGEEGRKGFLWFRIPRPSNRWCTSEVKNALETGEKGMNFFLLFGVMDEWVDGWFVRGNCQEGRQRKH